MWGLTYLVRFTEFEQSKTLLLDPEGNIRMEQLLCVNSTFDRTVNFFTSVKIIHTGRAVKIELTNMHYLMFQALKSFWRSAVATTSSATGDEGPVGGHATRNARNLLHSSVEYIAEERFGRSRKLHKIKPEIAMSNGIPYSNCLITYLHAIRRSFRCLYLMSSSFIFLAAKRDDY